MTELDGVFQQAELRCSDGESLIRLVTVPRSASNPDVLMWGDRHFVLRFISEKNRPVYFECQAVVVMPIPGIDANGYPQIHEKECRS